MSFFTAGSWEKDIIFGGHLKPIFGPSYSIRALVYSNNLIIYNFTSYIVEVWSFTFFTHKAYESTNMYFMEVSFVVTASIINSIAEERKSNIKDRSTWSLLALLFLYISHRVCDRRAMTPYCFWENDSQIFPDIIFILFWMTIPWVVPISGLFL